MVNLGKTWFFHFALGIFRILIEGELRRDHPVQKLKIGVDPSDEDFGNASYVGSK
jgi:hypothetical protein